MDPLEIYKLLAKVDPSGRACAKYVAECKAAGVDLSELGIEATEPASSRRIEDPDRTRPVQRYDDSPGPRVIATTRQGGAHPSARAELTPGARHMLHGVERAEFERAMGKTTMPAIGLYRTSSGNLRVVSGCPAEYRRQLAARRGAR